MHVARGEERHGLIVDPGAASALMGTDTLKHYFEHLLSPQDLARVSFEPSNATFTGVDGRPEPGLGVCTFPLVISGIPGRPFRTDLMGGTGSKCPGPLPLHVLMEYQACLV